MHDIRVVSSSSIYGYEARYLAQPGMAWHNISWHGAARRIRCMQIEQRVSNSCQSNKQNQIYSKTSSSSSSSLHSSGPYTKLANDACEQTTPFDTAAAAYLACHACTSTLSAQLITFQQSNKGVCANSHVRDSLQVHLPSALSLPVSSLSVSRSVYGAALCTVSRSD